MAKVFVKFPKTGLGNMMLVWAHAIVFARMNGLEVVTTSWWGFRWGALFRGEKRKRFYRNYFKETGFVKRNLCRWKLLFTEVIKDPDISELTSAEKKSNKIFLFQKMIRDGYLFRFLLNHQPLIKEELYKILNDQRKQELSKYPNPVIAVHIRRGDFKISNQTTPLSYFINAIKAIRESTKNVLPVTIFTDAENSELKEILELPEISVAKDKADVLDILLMSKSKILILSKDSTFSYWAAFLSDAFVIIPYNNCQEKIKNPYGNYVEIKWKENDLQSTENLKKSIQALNF